MSTAHGTIEFVNRHSGAVSIDVLDDDNDEYVVAKLPAGASTRQYTTPGIRWSVRVAYPCGITGATFLNLRDASGEEQFSQQLNEVQRSSQDPPAWTVEIQYVVTARTGAQSYVITAGGLEEVAKDRPGAVFDHMESRSAFQFRDDLAGSERTPLRSRQTGA